MKTNKIFTIIAAFAVILMAGCDNTPTIDKEYNPVGIDADESELVGEFRQGDQLSGAKIVLSYTNGLGRDAEILVPEVNGVYAEPMRTRLAGGNANDNGNGTIEIPLKGTPLTREKMNLRPTIKTSTHEVFITYEVTPTADIVLNAANSTVNGTYKIFEPVENASIDLYYTSTKPHKVMISVAEVVGISAPEFETTLEAAPNGATVNVPLVGTPQDHGARSVVIKVTKDGVDYTASHSVEIQGEIQFDLTASSVIGDLFIGETLNDVKIVLNYTTPENQDVTINVDEIEGMSCPPYDVTLPAATGGTIEIPLSGKPTTDGEVTIVVTMKKGTIIYNPGVKATVIDPEPGEVFEEETVVFNGLTYKTVFIDINGNGTVNHGDVWLDRNMGATSNDPGTYGAAGANPDAMGHYMQWGKPYGVTTFEEGYNIDYAATYPWASICPPGYEVPTREQFANAMAKVTGGTVSGSNVTGVSGITEKLMQPPLRLALSGWYANASRDLEAFGTSAGYWTSSEGSNTAPWKININNNTADNTGSGWADKWWQVPVRCIKTVQIVP